MITRIFAASCLALWIGILTSGGARATEPDSSTSAAEFVALLEFVGGSPLTRPERERIAAETQSQLRSDPAGVARSEAKTRKFLASLPKAAEWERASQRETIRYRFERLPATEPARQIVEQHDPTVVYDAANKRLVTEATLAAWERASVWMTHFLSVPAPDADFIATQRADVKANFASMPAAEQEAIAHIERDFPVGVLLFEGAEAQKRQEFIRQSRSEALDRRKLGARVAEAMSEAYDVALQREIVKSSVLLNAGFNYNGLYHMGMNHI